MRISLNRKEKGDLAELRVAGDLRARGHKVALPYGEDWDYDLIVERNGSLERVQVKYARSDGAILAVKCFLPFSDQWQGPSHQALHRRDDRLARCIGRGD